MKKEIIVRLHSQFEDIAKTWPETGTEFWLARDLQEVLGYARWENFRKVIDKAITSCQAAGYEPADHFLEVTKKVELGSGKLRLTWKNWMRLHKGSSFLGDGQRWRRRTRDFFDGLVTMMPRQRFSRPRCEEWGND